MELMLCQRFAYVDAQLAFVSAQLGTANWGGSFAQPSEQNAEMNDVPRVQVPRFNFELQDFHFNAGAWTAPPGVKPQTHTQAGQQSAETIHAETKEIQTEVIETLNASSQWEPLGDVSGEVGVQMPPVLDGAIARIAGTWLNNMRTSVEVVESSCYFNDGEPCPLELKDDAVMVNNWCLVDSGENDQVLQWQRDDEQDIFWFRNKSMAFLSGHWQSAAYDEIHVFGDKCSFEGDDAVDIEFAGDAVHLAGWQLLGLSEDNAIAYWKKGMEIVHWTLVSTDSSRSGDETEEEAEYIEKGDERTEDDGERSANLVVPVPTLPTKTDEDGDGRVTESVFPLPISQSKLSKKARKLVV